MNQQRQSNSSQADSPATRLTGLLGLSNNLFTPTLEARIEETIRLVDMVAAQQ